MRREITTGTYWFYRRTPDRCCMDMDVTLTRSIDGSVLQAAARRMIGRFPCLKFTCEKSEDGTRYFLVPNARPFSVVRAPGFVSLEDPRSGGYLWSLAYHDDHLYLRMFHGLTDGMGLVTVLRHLLIFYFSLLDGDPLPPDAADAGDDSPDGSTYADPFDFARTTEQTYTFRVPEPYLFAPEDADACVPYHRNLFLSLRQVLEAKQQTEGSVSGVIALLLANALCRINDDPSKCVVIKCPINLRPMLGCTETLQNCVSSFFYVYSDKVRKMPPTLQSSCFKGMLMVQSSEECLMNSFCDWRREVLEFNWGSSIAEKREAMKRSGGMYPVVSYLGSFTAGTYDRYIKGFDYGMDLGGSVGMLALSFGDTLYISVLLSEKHRAFEKALTDALESMGIDYRLE